jgi:hypothetical protein
LVLFRHPRCPQEIHEKLFPELSYVLKKMETVGKMIFHFQRNTNNLAQNNFGKTIHSAIIKDVPTALEKLNGAPNG